MSITQKLSIIQILSGDDNLVIKTDLTDRIGGSTGQNEDMISLGYQRVCIVYRSNFAETGQVAVLDIHTMDIIFALRLGLRAIFF